MSNVSNDAVLTPVIVGLVSVAQKVGMPSKFSPLLAAAIGAAAGMFYLYPHNYAQGAVNGILAGFGAVGLNSFVVKTPVAVKSLKKKKASAIVATVTDTPPAA